MNGKTRIILLALVAIAIVGTIWYLEMGKASPGAITVEGVDIAKPNATTTTTAPIDNSKSNRGGKAAFFPSAKEFVQPQGFINTPEFKLSELVGKKVVLIDFWTYSCINCIRTLPYLKAWYAKYKDSGFEIVGVHTPEFDFEKQITNVRQAVNKFGITYPVVLDSNYGTWGAYKNQYWPHEYLIDIDGYIVHDHIGEGGYEETERAIQNALQERKMVLGEEGGVPTGVVNPAGVEVVHSGAPISPETYFGSARNEYLGNGTRLTESGQTLTVPKDQNTNTLYLGGTWEFSKESAVNKTTNAEIVYPYQAQKVFFVASSLSGIKVQVLIDGAAPGARAGADVDKDGYVTIKENRLYRLIEDSEWGSHTIKLIIPAAGLNAFTFTFG